MRRPWKQHDEFSELESQLRAARAKPRPDLISQLVARVEASSAPFRPSRARFVLAGALTTAALAAFALVGGFSYTAAAAHGVAHAVGISHPNNAGGNGNSANSNARSAHSQYVEKTTICHRTNSATNPFVVITVSDNSLPAHKAHGDTLVGPGGTCPGPPIP